VERRRQPAKRAAAGGLRSVAPTLLQLRIELQWLKPPIWRRLLVPHNITLAKLHEVLQIAMGWTDTHLHEFWIGEARYGVPDPEWGSAEVIPEKRYTLAQSLMGVKTFTYVYDFGDNWQHKIRVEKILDNEFAMPAPICVQGANRRPPEDIGGPPGYAEFLLALADPAHEQHDEMLERWGESFDPTDFDIDEVNELLLKLKR
jgi:hypothetical protein